ncbi:MAG: Stp1/IreP family PP2C-type Ser/Thr phosphatase [Ignavibacteria bacterium]|nr:Stp1/IreP family PP2C-type Ser/Thr phosphatase [Ignavibacteria bacterium]
MDLNDITNKKYTFIFGNKSDVGRVREINEDYMESFTSSTGHFFIVCDGMGGHTSGEIASRLAVTTVKDYVTRNVKNAKSTKQLLAEAIQSANQTIIDKTIENPELAGMGTTCIALCIKAGVVYYANVGDSRLYIVRNNKIYQLTKDQSFVQTLIDQGHITYDEAESHPRKNELIQALGITENVVPEINKVGLQIFRNDKFVLCSDGLSGYVSDELMLNIVVQNDVYTSSEKLVAAANENGGFDNITVQVISITEGDDLPEDLRATPPLGVLDKNITTSNFIRDNKSTRQIPEFDFGNQSYKKKSNKGLIIFTAIFVLMVFSASMYILLFYEKAPKPIVTNNDSLTKNFSQNNKVTSNQNELEDFFTALYKGKSTDLNKKTEDYAPVRIDTILYAGRDKKEIKILLSDLLKRIKTEELEFNKYDPNNEVLNLKNIGESELLYKIKIEDIQDEKFNYKITSIKFYREIHTEKSQEVQKPSKTENKNKGGYNSKIKNNDLKENSQDKVTVPDKTNNKEEKITKDQTKSIK